MREVRVLVTGGTGVLGRALTPQLVKAGYTVRIMSRRDAPAGTTVEWARSDLAKGEGLAAAVSGVDVIIHAASSPLKDTQQVDVAGAGRLLAAARGSGVGHFVYISIVGIDRIPFFYYRYKLAAEKLIESGDVPWSNLRATQFHNLIDMWLHMLARIPLILPVPKDLPFQPIDAGEVAALLVEAVSAGPAGRLPDAGGPEVLKMGEMAATWRQARGLRRPMVHLPFPGEAAAGFRHGHHLTPNKNTGGLTWSEWLEEQYGRQAIGNRRREMGNSRS